MKNEPFVIERTFNAAVEKIWKAITDRDQMKEWYFDISEFKPVVGFEFQFEGKSESHTYLHLCKITEVVVNKRLTYSWRYDGHPGISYVTFELFDEGGKTRLKLTHSGLESFGNKGDYAIANFVQGWTQLIGSLLKAFVETAFIRKSIEISASPEKVWEILVNLEFVKDWAGAFSPGAYVETDWKKGSVVRWKDKDHQVGATGVVTENEFASKLKISFYDDPQQGPPLPPGETYEAYLITPRNGKTILSIESGPLSQKHAAAHDPLFEKAMHRMKTLAEN